MTHKLLPLDEMIKRIPAQGLSDRLTPPMQETADLACREVMLKHKPTLWESLPSFLQNSIIFRIRGIVPEVAKQIILDLQKKPAYYLSLKTLVLDVVTSKPFLVVDLFKSAGKDPMAYLIRFSLVAGFVVGVLLAGISLLGIQWYWLIVVGVVLGALANELALESLFFHPDHGTIQQWVAIKRDAAKIFASKLEAHLMAARVYLNDALRIEEVIVERLSGLPAMDIMRDGETRSLAAGDSIMAGDVITASDSGRASIILSNSYGEPIGNLLVAPTGSVIADTTLKNGQTALVFEALSDDGVTIANLDPDFAEMVELQGVDQAGSEGGMFGLFGGGLLAG
eukprot:gene16280-16092_t